MAVQVSQKHRGASEGDLNRERFQKCNTSRRTRSFSADLCPGTRSLGIKPLLRLKWDGFAVYLEHVASIFWSYFGVDRTLACH